MAAGPPPETTPASSSRHRRRNLIVVSVVLVIVVFLLVFVIPFSMPFSFRANYDYENVLIVPSGSHVSGTFSTNNSDQVGFFILGPGNDPVYQAHGASGSFSLTSPGSGLTIQIFLFGQECTVAVSGTYTAPIVWSTSFPIP